MVRLSSRAIDVHVFNADPAVSADKAHPRDVQR
jgi:hypothetical protein